MAVKFSFKKRVNSFKYAIAGLKIMFEEEHNARVHLLAAIVVVIASFYFHISSLEWVLVVFAIGFVF